MGDPPMGLTIISNPVEACLLPAAGPGYPDDTLLEIYRNTRTIAMVGASPNWNRPSYFVMRYLQRKGFRVIPVNPRAVDEPILGEQVYPDLESVPGRIDVVDVFRRPEETPAIARSAVAMRAKVLWLQLGIANDEAMAIAEAGGLSGIQNRCMKIEYGRLGGELAWSGVNTRQLSSRRGRPLG
jgi:predicted CoA-binding protein